MGGPESAGGPAAQRGPIGELEQPDALELRLRAGEERYRSLVAALDEGIVLHGADGSITACNASAVRILGLTEDELLGRTSVDPRWRAMHEDGSPFPGEEHPAMVTLRTGEPQRNVLMAVHRPDGSVVWISINSQPLIRAGERAPYAVVASFSDITEQRHARRELERLLKESQEAIRVRDEFLAIAAHELRTPLTSALLNLHRLLRLERRSASQPPRLADIFHMVRGINRQVDRLHRLVEELLDISRITGGQLRLEPEPVDLGGLVTEVVERISEDLRRARCAITLEAPAGVVGFWDRLRLDQVVTILLTNAIKYGADRPIRISIAADEATARLAVQDQGIGIAPPDQERIFQRFERAVSTQHYGGFGLGLWITRQIVEAMGGTIRVSSALGEGSTFVVELPRAADAGAGAPRS